MTTSTKKALLAALVVPAIALTAACTSGADDAKSARAASSGRSDGGSAKPPVPARPQSADAVGGTALTTGAGPEMASDSLDSLATASQKAAQTAPDAADPAAQTKVATPAIISKGQISLRSKDIDAARFDLQKVLDTLAGTIDDEQSNADKEGRTIRQRLVLRVPSKYFGKAMEAISDLDGVKLVSRSRSAEDVTTQVIDVQSRIRTQRASLARVQALLAQATNLNQIISIESQLSRRQAQLDSLEAQQKYLADQTSMSTITVYLTVPPKKHAAKDHRDHHDFFSGLASGWDSLGRSTNAVLTGVGAVLPFAALAALLGFPLWVLWRRRPARPGPDTAPAS